MKNFESGFAHNEAQEKQALWEKTLEELNHIGDKLGYPLEDGVKETVAAFLVNNFPTAGSCEGHVEERFGEILKLSPYVDFGSKGPAQRFVEEWEIKKLIARERGLRAEDVEENESAEQAYWDYIQEHGAEETPEFIENREKNGELGDALAKLLEDFYRGRQVNPNTKLAVRHYDASYYSRVTTEKHTSKRDEKKIEEDEIEQYKQQLLAEQQEVRALTEFLKERFLPERNKIYHPCLTPTPTSPDA